MILTHPTIHSGGTSGGELRIAYMRAALAVEVALVVIASTYPNGRDYYPQGPGAILAAFDEHNSRRDRLISVGDELAAMAEGITT